MTGQFRCICIIISSNCFRECTDSSYAVFSAPDFDANDYANAILAGDPFVPANSAVAAEFQQTASGKISKQTSTLSALSEPAKEDLSVAISKLTVGIDDVSKQLKSVVRNIGIRLYLMSYFDFQYL